MPVESRGMPEPPLTWADNRLSPIHTAYYNCYLENSNC
jgi:hypothetical protein